MASPADPLPTPDPTPKPADDPTTGMVNVVNNPPKDTTGIKDVQRDRDAISVAPPRANQSLVNQLDLKWHELKYFVASINGDVEGGDLAAVLSFVRSKL